MIKKILPTTALLLVSYLLTAQTLNIDGQYLDKKNNPIDNALITYYTAGDLILDSTRSNTNGSFELTLDFTGIHVTDEDPNNPFISIPYPNPFTGICNFKININAPASILITDISGRQVDKYEIKTPGTYSCSWGGMNNQKRPVSSGIYNISVVDASMVYTRKVQFSAYASQGLAAVKINESHYKSTTLLQDRINFTKGNTSVYDLLVNQIASDTSVGVIVGNVGPVNLGPIIETVHIDSTNTWNLNDYFYNDDQSSYETSNADFVISDDSIMTYIGASVGTYSFDIIATDPQQSNLISGTQAQITITNQQDFNCSGYYLDNSQQPIVGATITYWEGGSVFSSQATSTGSGYWNMSVTTSGTAQDKIGFVKTNTTEFELFFITPSADTAFGDVVGNIGPESLSSINETHFTIDGVISWNLNDHFINDDQSIYTFTGSDYSIVQDTLLELSTQTEGTFSTTVTATDPQDASLTAVIMADVIVEYTISIPDADIIEDYQSDTLFANLNQYINPNYQQGLTYAIVSQSNTQLIDLTVQDSLIMINSLQADSSGSSQIGVKIIGSTYADTVYFTVNVNAQPDVRGYITDILDTLNVGISGVSIEMTLDSITFYTATTDASGYYSIQLPEEATLSYYVTTIRLSGYTPFHTWATVDQGTNDVSEDYTIIPDDFVWDLYIFGFRDTTGGGFPFYKRVTTHHWLTPPTMHTFSDNSLVGGTDLTIQYNNLVYNIQNILPTFNPRDAIPSNLVEHTTFGYQLQDGEMGAYFDNSIFPAAGVVGIMWDGPQMIKCHTAYYESIGGTTGSFQGADNTVFNQELGTGFGCVTEPAVSSNYESVFTQPCPFDTYTQDDYDCATVMLNRARVHYMNLSFEITDPEGYDWEMRPDEVQTWYPGTSKSTGSQTLVYKVIGFNGEIIEEGSYSLDEVPSRVMKMAKIIFTPEEIATREKEENAK